MRPWHLGNTTVRSPFRLRDGLIALSKSSLQGNLRGREQEIAFREILGESGIVSLGEDETYSVARKWRAALSQLGFLYPEVPKKSGIDQDSIGKLDTITPNGWRLIQAETVPAMQECFLRSLAAYFIPSLIETAYTYRIFSPLRHMLCIMRQLLTGTGDSSLGFIEMAVVVQLSSTDDDINDIIKRVLILRESRKASPNKRKFDAEERELAAKQHKYVPRTFNDYADTNFRYLKATGLVQRSGRGISLVESKLVFTDKLISDRWVPETDTAYLMALCNGVKLPTDDKDSAMDVLEDLVSKAKIQGLAISLDNKSTRTVADIANVRYEIEELLANKMEDEYANKQALEWEEISKYMELLIKRQSRATLLNGDEIKIPQSEAPAYFEWVLWRAFLAIDSLINKPYEARRFKIDQDFLPIGTAPGNGPDLIFEFKDFVLVVEVTLTTNSRQEAAEGEPVRRHVAEIVTKFNTIKPVYGLFIANHIDSNTAETFRIGVWYAKNDNKMKLDIIPLTLNQFRCFFDALFTNNRIEVSRVQQLLNSCSDLRKDHEAPAWKTAIHGCVSYYTKSIAK